MGLKSFITGAPKYRTPPTPGSKTQKRKANRANGWTGGKCPWKKDES